MEHPQVLSPPPPLTTAAEALPLVGKQWMIQLSYNAVKQIVHLLLLIAAVILSYFQFEIKMADLFLLKEYSDICYVITFL